MAEEKQRTSEIDVYEYELGEANQIINKLCYNWSFIKICYELWENEIITARGRKIKLHKIAGVGMNYINEICALRVKQGTCNRIFNVTNETEVLSYLRGDNRILEIPNFNQYILLNIIYNDWINKKRCMTYFTDRDDEKLKESEKKLKRIEDWLEKNYKRTESLKDYLDGFKNNVKNMIAKDIMQEYIGKEHPLKKIKGYLLGKYTQITDKEQSECLENIYYLLLKTNCDMLTAFTDSNLEILKEILEKFLYRVQAEYNYRDVRRQEKEIMKDTLKNM